MLLLTVPGISKNESLLCMNNCLSESQLYDTEYLFCISRPNKIYVSGSLVTFDKGIGKLEFSNENL